MNHLKETTFANMFRLTLELLAKNVKGALTNDIILDAIVPTLYRPAKHEHPSKDPRYKEGFSTDDFVCDEYNGHIWHKGEHYVVKNFVEVGSRDVDLTTVLLNSALPFPDRSARINPFATLLFKFALNSPFREGCVIKPIIDAYFLKQSVIAVFGVKLAQHRLHGEFFRRTTNADKIESTEYTIGLTMEGEIGAKTGLLSLANGTYLPLHNMAGTLHLPSDGDVQILSFLMYELELIKPRVRGGE